MLDTIKRPIAYRKRTITHVSSCIWEETWHPKEKGFRAGEFHDMRGKNFSGFFELKKKKKKDIFMQEGKLKDLMMLF